MPETILVTGATGTVGSRVVHQLLSRGTDARVRAGVHTESKATALKAAGAHVVELDMDSPGSVEQAVAGVDKIFLLTPSEMNYAVQITNVLSAAEIAQAKKIVRLSALGAEEEPGITLTRLHRSAELAIMGSGLDWTFLRPNGFMQNFQMFADPIKSQGAFYLPLGDARVSYIDADDIADLAATILLDNSGAHSGRAYNLTGPEALSGSDVADIFSSVLGKPVVFHSVPDEAAEQAMLQQGMPKPLVDALIELYQAYRKGVGSTVSSAVASIKGRAAKSFRQYVADNRGIYS